MNDAPSRRPKFTLLQLLVMVTVIAATVLYGIAVSGLILGLGIPPLRSERKRTATISEALSHGIGALGMLGLMYGAVLFYYTEIFKALDVPLPAMTIGVIRASEAALRYPGLAISLVTLLVAVDAGVFCFLHSDPSKRGCARLWSGFITAFLACAIIVSVVALLWPLFVMMENITLSCVAAPIARIACKL